MHTYLAIRVLNSNLSKIRLPLYLPVRKCCVNRRMSTSALVEHTFQWDVHNCEGSMCSKLEYFFPVSVQSEVDCVWNVMAHAQKPDFVFRRNGRFHLTSVQSTTGSRGVRISGSNAGYTRFRGSVKGTGYPLHSPVYLFTSPPQRHRAPSHFNWTLHQDFFIIVWICCCLYQ